MTIARNLSFLAEGVSSTGVLGATYGGTGQSSITTGDLLYGSASNTISKLAIGSTGTILRVVAGVPAWGTDYTGTVTSVAALTLGTTGTDLSSTVANGTTTPVITLNVPTASATNRGVLSSTDWTTFNNKGSGSVTSVAATVPSFLSISGSPITTSGTLAITLSGTALPVANGGTGLTSLTAGQVLYGSFSQNSNFSYSTTNGLTANSYNIGYNTNLYNVDSALSSYASNNSVYLNGNAAGALQLRGDGTGAQQIIIKGGSSSYVSINTASAEAARIFASGGVSIGNTTDPGATNLSVTGKYIGKTLTQGNQTSDTNQLFKSSSSGVFGLSPTTQISQWQSSGSSNTFTITFSGRLSGLVVVGVANSASGSQSAGGVFLVVATDTVLQVTTISQTGWVVMTTSTSGLQLTFTLALSATGYWNATLLGTAVA